MTSKLKVDPFARRVQQAIRLLDRMWVVPILWDMRDGPRRPFQLAIVVGAASKVIDDTVRYTIRAGLVDYTLIKDGDRAAKAYELTDLGRQSLDLFVVIHDWAEDHLPPPGEDLDDDDVIDLDELRASRASHPERAIAAGCATPTISGPLVNESPD